jgi:hypothetical protein
VPQFLQKFAIAALGVLQVGHTRCSDWPQFWQKLASSGFSNPQLSHLTETLQHLMTPLSCDWLNLCRDDLRINHSTNLDIIGKIILFAVLACQGICNFWNIVSIFLTIYQVELNGTINLVCTIL